MFEFQSDTDVVDALLNLADSGIPTQFMVTLNGIVQAAKILRCQITAPMIGDIPKPNVVCPECAHSEAFFHCARHDDRGIYTWGTLVTCLRCKTTFCII